MIDAFTRLATALGRSYRIEREFGAGGMATVYLAQDLKHDRDVALKVLKADLAESLGRERFLREIRLAPDRHPRQPRRVSDRSLPSREPPTPHRRRVDRCRGCMNHTY